MGCLPFRIVRDQEKNTSNSLTSLTKRVARCRLWHRSKKQYGTRHTKDTISSPRPYIEHCARRRLSEQHKQEVSQQLEREHLEQELLERQSQSQKGREQKHIEHETPGRNNLETELAEEHTFDWNRLEPAVSAPSATYKSHQRGPILSKNPSNRRPLKHKNTSQSLRELYYLQDKPLPRIPQPPPAGQKPSGQPQAETINTSPLQDDFLVYDDDISDISLGESVQLPRQEEARWSSPRRIPSEEVSPRSQPVRTSNPTVIHQNIASRFDLDTMANHDPMAHGSEDHTQDLPSPSFDTRGSNRTSIASKSEEIDPWAMFDAYAKNDSQLNPFGAPRSIY